MARRLRGPLPVWFLLAAGMGWSAATMAGIAVSPVVLEIDSPRKAIAVTVTNTGEQAVTFQTATLLWKQVEGADQNEPTDDLLVVPAIVEVPAKASQVFRVMLRSRAPSPVERSYRILLEDISEAVTAEAGSANISFKFAHSLPVMIAPAGEVINAVHWQACRPASAASMPASASAEACVRLRNAGNRRVKVQALTLTGDGWQEVLTLENGVNVLAGAEREWHIPVTRGREGPVQGVKVLTAHGETLQAELTEF